MLRLLSGAAGAAAASTAAAGETTPAASNVVRLASVVSPRDGGLYGDLLPDFERQTGYHVALTTPADVYGAGRLGQADVILSHFGYPQVQPFVLAGFGLWPETVFFNPHALLGPPQDPANVRGLTDVAEAFRRIAATASPFLVNHLEGLDYLTAVLWQAAGRPARGTWYRDPGVSAALALTDAARLGAYVLWGLTPFLVAQRQHPVALDPLVLGDPLLHRIMVTVVVNPTKVSGVNATGAAAFQRFLLSPATQARIRAFVTPGTAKPEWWPAGGDNAPGLLPMA